MKCVLCIVQCEVCSGQCSVCNVQCEVCSGQCSVCNVQCSVKWCLGLECLSLLFSPALMGPWAQVHHGITSSLGNAVFVHLNLWHAGWKLGVLTKSKRVKALYAYGEIGITKSISKPPKVWSFKKVLQQFQKSVGGGAGCGWSDLFWKKTKFKLHFFHVVL